MSLKQAFKTCNSLSFRAKRGISAEDRTDMAVVVCPGGGGNQVSIDKEGHDIAIPNVDITAREGGRLTLRFDRTRTTAAEVIAQLSRHCRIRDLKVREPAIEDAIRKVYES